MKTSLVLRQDICCWQSRTDPNARKTHTNQDAEAQTLARAESREASRKVIGADLKLSALPACRPALTTHSPLQARGKAVETASNMQNQPATRDFPSLQPTHTLGN